MTEPRKASPSSLSDWACVARSDDVPSCGTATQARRRSINLPSGRLQGEHPLHIPGHGHKAPLASHIVEPAQEKLVESHCGLDDAEDRLGRAFALGVER